MSKISRFLQRFQQDFKLYLQFLIEFLYIYLVFTNTFTILNYDRNEAKLRYQDFKISKSLYKISVELGSLLDFSGVGLASSIEQYTSCIVIPQYCFLIQSNFLILQTVRYCKTVLINNVFSLFLLS